MFTLFVRGWDAGNMIYVIYTFLSSIILNSVFCGCRNLQLFIKLDDQIKTLMCVSKNGTEAFDIIGKDDADFGSVDKGLIDFEMPSWKPTSNRIDFVLDEVDEIWHDLPVEMASNTSWIPFLNSYVALYVYNITELIIYYSDHCRAIIKPTKITYEKWLDPDWSIDTELATPTAIEFNEMWNRVVIRSTVNCLYNLEINEDCSTCMNVTYIDKVKFATVDDSIVHWRKVTMTKRRSIKYFENYRNSTDSIEIKTRFGTLCVSMLVKMCDTCKMFIRIHQNGVSVELPLIESDVRWHEVNLSLDEKSLPAKYDTYNLTIKTNSTRNDTKQFWHMRNVKYCGLSGMKISKDFKQALHVKEQMCVSRKNDVVRYTSPKQDEQDVQLPMANNLSYEIFCSNENDNNRCFCMNVSRYGSCSEVIKRLESNTMETESGTATTITTQDTGGNNLRIVVYVLFVIVGFIVIE